VLHQAQIGNNTAVQFQIPKYGQTAQVHIQQTHTLRYRLSCKHSLEQSHQFKAAKLY